MRESSERRENMGLGGEHFQFQFKRRSSIIGSFDLQNMVLH